MWRDTRARSVRAATGAAPPRGAEPALAARAAYRLRGNDLGAMTASAADMYPHLWSWDAAFAAIGLAKLDLQRAVRELDTLLAAQWSTGMLPHIVFAAEQVDYFPGPERWGCRESGAPAPVAPPTSGICQPPVHAFAVQRVVAAGRHPSRSDRDLSEAFLRRAWVPMMAWHRWLAEQRDPEAEGLITIYHSWESGIDNCPRWDGPYSRVVVGDDLPPYRRRDKLNVTDPSQRPTDADYDRYIWLVEQMRRVGYADASVRGTCDFAVKDVFTSAIMAAASEVLAEVGEETRAPAVDVADLRAWAARFRAGVVRTVDTGTGLARDRDLRADSWISSETIAGFAPLLSGGLDPAAQRRMLATFDSPTWCAHPRLVAPAPPSTSPEAAVFRPREYARGPYWPVLFWLFGWAFERHGWPERATQMRDAGLWLTREGDFAEYYEPFTGEPLGGTTAHSLTAAVVLDWLCSL